MKSRAVRGPLAGEAGESKEHSEPRSRRAQRVRMALLSLLLLLLLLYLFHPHPHLALIPGSRVEANGGSPELPSTQDTLASRPFPKTSVSQAHLLPNTSPTPPTRRSGDRGEENVHPPVRVALLLLVIDSFPPWWSFLVESYRINHPFYQLIAVHTSPPPRVRGGDAHIRFEHLPKPSLASLFASKLGTSLERVEAKLASAKGLSDLKPFYGKVFENFLLPSGQQSGTYTHWGWVDWDLLLGDVRAVVPDRLLWSYDALTFAGATLGFAWAGQLSILRNTRATRELYSAVPSHLSLGLKSSGDGQSGWEERVLLRETLRAANLTILFHMAAQFDHKAQWLTWVPFDHFWEKGKIWRCARTPLAVKGRPSYLVQDRQRWLDDVELIQRDPRRFFKRSSRVCIRWDLESSPW
ncbi:MAG: hypothetical protein SGPRY_014443, partial [Prymnesium sp.]